MNKTITDQGCFTQMLETPQQGIDVIESAINTCFGNFDNSSHLNMALNIGAHEIYEMVSYFWYLFQAIYNIFVNFFNLKYNF